MTSAAVDWSAVCWVVDPGHAWLAVPAVTCEGLAFSEFSYIDRAAGVVYLEEDCDAGIWFGAHVVGACPPVSVTYLDHDAPLRDLPRVPASGRVRV